MPLPHTVIDLWRMIYEHKCLTIVMLNQRDEQNQVWPVLCIFYINESISWSLSTRLLLDILRTDLEWGIIFWVFFAVFQTYGQYWPEENEECECGPFVIEIVSISRPTPDVVLRKLKLCYNSNVSPAVTCELLRRQGKIVSKGFDCWWICVAEILLSAGLLDCTQSFRTGLNLFGCSPNVCGLLISCCGLYLFWLLFWYFSQMVRLLWCEIQGRE